MPSLTRSIEVLGLLSSIANASPVNIAESLAKRGEFALGQVEAGKYARHGPSAVLKAYRKFNAPLPSNLRRIAAPGQGSVPARPADSYDSYYLTPVTLGCVSTNLDLDTGSSDLWVFSNQQPADQTAGHKLYNPTSCKTSQELEGASWNIRYGDDSGASGNVFVDKVVVGAVTATAQAIEAATSVSQGFIDEKPLNGLMGLGFSKINSVTPKKVNTFFDTVKGQLARPVFGVDLKYHGSGTYDFGYVDTSKFKGQMTFVPVDSSRGFWGFSTDGYQIGTGPAKKTRVSGIADTGTTLLLISDAIVREYYAQVAGAAKDADGFWGFDCKTVLPDLTFSIGGTPHTIPGKYMNYAPNGDGTCFGGVQNNAGIGFNIFGDIFLKSQYVVFSAEGTAPQIGFAQQ